VKSLMGLGKSGGYLIQSNFGNKGNFEVVAAVQGGHLQHFYRDNDDPKTPWAATATFGSNIVGSPSLIQSNLGNKGNFEVVVRIGGGQFQHFYRDNDKANTPWAATEVFGSGVTGATSLIQSNVGNKGNFEVVAAVGGKQLEHFFRNNDVANTPWASTKTFATLDMTSATSLIQSNYGDKDNFEVVATFAGGELAVFYRNNDDGTWGGDEAVGYGGITGAISLIQSNYGKQGNFEVVGALSGQLQHFYRNNDASDPTSAWFIAETFGSNIAGMGV
jgi:hypothetical protein